MFYRVLKKDQNLKEKIEVAGNMEDRKAQNARVDGWGMINAS